MRSSFCLLLSLGVLMSQAGCDRVSEVLNRGRQLRQEKIFAEDMARIAQDTQGAYCFEYVLEDAWTPETPADGSQMRAIQGGKFEVTAWVGLEAAGGMPSDITSVIYDPAKGAIAVIDTGPNIVRIDRLLGLLRPTRYREIKRPVPTKAAKE